MRNMNNLREYVVLSALDVTEGTSYDDAAKDISRTFGLPLLKAEMFLEMELQIIDMNLYVEGVFGNTKSNRTSGKTYNTRDRNYIQT